MKSRIFTIIPLIMITILCISSVESKEAKLFYSVPTITEEVSEPTPEKPKYKEIQLIATAYCACEKCCGKWAKNRGDKVYGASGKELIAGVSIAVDPKVFPYGTEIIINGNTYVAHDCGGAIKGNKIDIYFENHDDALKFGRQKVIGFIEQ